jgi:hypothetical protein
MPEGVGYSGSNVVAGAGLDLNYVQDRVYAYSGMYQVASSNVKHLEFRTGKKLIIAEFTAIAAALPATVADGAISLFKININGITIATVKTDSSNEDMPNNAIIPLVIPPYTTIEVNVESDKSTGSMETSCLITGKTL